MKSRRTFIRQGTLASAAVAALSPLQTIANSSLGSAMGFKFNDYKLVMLHPDKQAAFAGYASKKIKELCRGPQQTMILDSCETELIPDNFRVVYKGAIKTGIIDVSKNMSITDVSGIAQKLKENHNCDLVVCYSNLGYRQPQGPDDVKLAETSTHIDIIIGAHPENYSRFPLILRNKNREEVAVHHATGNGFGLGNIEIEFDPKTGAKKSILFNNLLKRLPHSA